MGPSPILSVVHTVTVGTMLNLNGGNNGHMLKNVTCEHTFIPQDVDILVSRVALLWKCFLWSSDDSIGTSELCPPQPETFFVTTCHA